MSLRARHGHRLAYGHWLAYGNGRNPEPWPACTFFVINAYFSRESAVVECSLTGFVCRRFLLVRARQYSATMISPPMITMSQYEGPWPKCLGMSGEDCVTYIETYGKNLDGGVYIVHPGEAVTRDFRTNRVRIYVNESGVVTAIPDRG